MVMEMKQVLSADTPTTSPVSQIQKSAATQRLPILFYFLPIISSGYLFNIFFKYLPV